MTRFTSSRKTLARCVAGPLLFAALAVSPRTAEARDLWEDEMGDRYVSLNTALKSVLLVSEPLYLPGETSATNFWRLRLDLDSAITPWLTSNVAYEQRAVLSAGSTALGGGAFLPQTGEFPYRVIPAGGAIVDDPDLLYEHGLDRLNFSFRGDWGQATIGRQAIGFGRSSFFTAVDVLAPFGTFQVDQEWKPGVDAIDLEWQAGMQYSFGFTAAAESDFDDGAFLGRAIANFGNLDLILLGGKRSEDWMAGLAGSMPISDAEVHGEFASFFTDGQGVVNPQFGDSGAIKASLGGSYTFNVLSGLSWLTEYHFNGFGLIDIEREQIAFIDPAFSARFSRGDFQTLGIHQVASSLNLTIDEAWMSYGYAVISGQDGSGMGALGGTYNASEVFSVDLSAFIPWGRAPDTSGLFPSLKSEYGATPLTVYASLRFYD